MIRLSPLEEEIMDVLWMVGKAFPRKIMDYLSPPIPPYNTILSTIRKLEKMEYLGYEKYGKMHEYYPILKKKEYSRSLLGKLYHDLMEGSQEKLFSFFMEEENIDVDELKKMLDRLKNKDL